MTESELLETAESLLEEAARIVDLARRQRPLVVHLSNAVVLNDQANVTLAVGASPLMSNAKEEQEALLDISSALLLNIGTVHAEQAEVMREAARAAKGKSVPIVLDPVGVGATQYRKDVATELLSIAQPAVIKGNAGEIDSLAQASSTSLSLARGVDSSQPERSAASFLTWLLARNHSTVVILHGAVDYVSDADLVVELSNGHERLAGVTGTGCNLGSVVAAYVGALPKPLTPRAVLAASIAGLSTVNIAAELAVESGVKGSAGFKTAWIDQLGEISGEVIRQRTKIRVLAKSHA